MNYKTVREEQERKRTEKAKKELAEKKLLKSCKDEDQCEYQSWEKEELQLLLEEKEIEFDGRSGKEKLIELLKGE